MTDSIRHAGRWTLEERFASPWHYLPVEVPPGTGALRVELDYDRGDGAVLDLGCFGPGGFRGWSGGARESFVGIVRSTTSSHNQQRHPSRWPTSSKRAMGPR